MNYFIVVIPVYNAEKYIEKCIQSVINQSYRNFKMVIVDDGSTDNTSNILKSYSDIAKIITCKQNNGSAVGSIALAIQDSKASGSDIIINLDGDDWLAHNDVLGILNDIYDNKEIWMTYGQYKPLSETYSNYCQPLTDIRNYRRTGKWITSHLRTYKKWLWDKIDNEDLKDDDGEYYKFSGDLAIMFALVEMSGLKHIKFIPDILYIYNDLNILNEMKRDGQRQITTEKRIRAIKIYDELTIGEYDNK